MSGQEPVFNRVTVKASIRNGTEINQRKIHTQYLHFKHTLTEHTHSIFYFTPSIKDDEIIIM